MDSRKLSRHLLVGVLSIALGGACAGKPELEGRYSNARGQFVEFKENNKANVNVNGVTLELDYTINGKEVILGPAGGGAIVATITDAGCLDLGGFSVLGPLCKE